MQAQTRSLNLNRLKRRMWAGGRGGDMRMTGTCSNRILILPLLLSRPPVEELTAGTRLGVPAREAGEGIMRHSLRGCKR